MNMDVTPSRAVGNSPVPSATAIPLISALEVHEPNTEVLQENGIVAWGNGPDTRAINLLRAQLRKRLESQGINLIGITSAEPDAGKSFVTVNLAVALSRIDGQQVMLFDFDLRRPTVADRLGIDTPVGLEAWLSGEVENLSDVGRRFGQTGLSVYVARSQHERAGELIAGARFDSLINGLGKLPKSTIVLCDLPPAFVSDDAVTVVERLDSYIHVIDEGITPRRQVQEVRAMMAPKSCVGAVLNRYTGGWNDSYGYAAARKYSRYYDDPKG